ncbi:MAG: hypothetical protein IT385_30930 [Deltaproteobacteria bacterium]|nr:hypothetical protein [Deltaproteobacteria bacterium]
MRRLVGALVAALVLIAARAEAAPPSARSRIVFHGWSPDSQLVAYTRERATRTGGALQRMHRFVRGGAFDGFGRMVGGDVATYARERGYVAHPAAQRREGPTRWHLRFAERVLTLDVVIGRQVSWVLSEAGRELARHTFDRIYLDFEPELYPSPDGSQAVLVMHLDTGWEVDAAIFPVGI